MTNKSEQACIELLTHLKTMASYWAVLPNLTPIERTEGMLFSVLTTIDGSTEIPPLLLVPVGEDGDETPFEPINADFMLHEMLADVKGLELNPEAFQAPAERGGNPK